MIEDSIEDYPDPSVMCSIDESREGVVIPQASIDLIIIDGVVAMPRGLKNWSQIQGIGA
jgi:hypothetical protein